MKSVRTVVSSGNGRHFDFGLLLTLSTLASGFSVQISWKVIQACSSNRRLRFHENSTVSSFNVCVTVKFVEIFLIIYRYIHMYMNRKD